MWCQPTDTDREHPCIGVVQILKKFWLSFSWLIVVIFWGYSSNTMFMVVYMRSQNKEIYHCFNFRKQGLKTSHNSIIFPVNMILVRMPWQKLAIGLCSLAMTEPSSPISAILQLVNFCGKVTSHILIALFTNDSKNSAYVRAECDFLNIINHLCHQR